MDAAHDVLDFWFNRLPPGAWWRKDPALDRDIAARFGDLHKAAAADDLDPWRRWPGHMLALILVLDQFSRNIFRDDPRAFAADAKARALAVEALDRGIDLGFARDAERLFLYLPFEHSEALEDQDRACDLCETRIDGPDAPIYRQFAEAHRDVIRRFGRFPHRNAILGRQTTPEEAAYLAEPGAGF